MVQEYPSLMEPPQRNPVRKTKTVSPRAERSGNSLPASFGLWRLRGEQVFDGVP
jgi:hypothetical protein